ncbi:hypothetical protein [Staphylococcus chromogenes]|uniref:hypothetical protein n=1 Tax=Staphylococcus chromogenes TaxID=46126 RepID=UPI001319FD8B|nr:hypothetical protein [Staphylococcus chromogenes]
MNQIETYLENKEKNLTSQIENTANTQERKTLRKQRSQIKKAKKQLMILENAKLNMRITRKFMVTERAIQQQILMRHL